MPASEIIRIAITVGVVQGLMDVTFNYLIFNSIGYQNALIKLSDTKWKVEQIKKQQQQEEINNKNAISSNVNTNSTSATTITTSATNKKKVDKNEKKNVRIENDYKVAIAAVTQYHTIPNIVGGIVFMLLLKILGTELQGSNIALLPFTPFSLLRRITTRGLQYLSTSTTTTTTSSSTAAAAVKDLTTILLYDPNHSYFSSMTNKNSNIRVESVAQSCSYFFIYMLCTASVKFYVHKLLSVQPPIESANTNTFLTMLDTPTGHQILRATGIDPNELQNHATTGTSGVTTITTPTTAKSSSSRTSNKKYK